MNSPASFPNSVNANPLIPSSPTHMSSLIILYVYFFLIVLAPMTVCGWLCRERNRTVAKGIVVGLLGGWIAALVLWLGLRTRNPETQMLY
jgi:hypothetical protein